jgi:hypothetical protein
VLLNAVVAGLSPILSAGLGNKNELAVVAAGVEVGAGFVAGCGKENECSVAVGGVTIMAGFSSGFGIVNPLAGGADIELESGGADGGGVVLAASAFFCSCNLALIFLIASASKSCFSHLLKLRKASCFPVVPLIAR